MRITVYSAHPFEQNFLAKANKQKHQLKFVNKTLTLETAQKAVGSQAIALFTSDNASAEVLEYLHNLGVRYVALRSAGFDYVDLQKAKELGMLVARVPAYSPYAIAEHTAALLLALNRHLILAHQRIEQNNFCLDNLIGFDLNGKTVGIIGLGKIGAVFARIMHGFGCRILLYDVVEPAPQGFPIESVSFDTLLRESDIISLHAPLNAATHYMINAETLAKTKEGVLLLNTSRGGLVNTADLIQALQNGQVSAAGLDVYENERHLFFQDLSDQPLTDELFAQLKALPNVLITGHQAFLTQTALTNIADTTLHNLTCFETGSACENLLFAG
ncbi:2-hydroxyacid dehydrogenase [Rufibacter hautae]|uniref:2-hydroxyacid dehydrogenase n=1 Tax=Rufibacter hautae TaxID=2595005 RepID=A0A5B6TDE7_9BACT|nr:2-hydroxyacid dehydrogenase [Rufibacter hautae]KAA3437133.1 2-hydroxyacid dehydrogenase [Rufibacter hautae]